MAKAILARRRGDDFQAYYFWKRACDMFLPTSNIEKTGFEVAGYGAFDDVAVLYRRPRSCNGGLNILGDFLQVKYSVDYGKPITVDGLMDPAFINATTTSLLQRLRDAVTKMRQAADSHRFVLVAPWHIAQDDVLARLYRREDGGINLDRLFNGTTRRSEMGKVRRRLAEHLDLEDETELKPILERLRIECVREDVETILNELRVALATAGFTPMQTDKLTDRYCQLPWSLCRQGHSWFGPADLEAVARNEGLWWGRLACPSPRPSRVGIRSFMRWAEGMEDETDAMLCLCRYFVHRRINSPGLWSSAVLPAVAEFLRKQVNRGGAYLLDMQVLTSVAFLAGYLLEPKLGASIDILQNRTTEPWSVHPSLVRAVNDRWTMTVQAGVGSDDLAVGISVARPVEEDVLEYVRAAAVPARAIAMLGLAEGPNQVAIANGTEAFALAQHAVNKVMQARRAHGVQGRTHLFIAAPNGFSFFLGQLARPLGHLRLYEYAFEDNRLGAYTPSLDLSNDIGSDRTGES